MEINTDGRVHVGKKNRLWWTEFIREDFMKFQFSVQAKLNANKKERESKIFLQAEFSPKRKLHFL